MKRQALFVLASAMVLAACDGFKEAMSAHQDVVARAGSQELSVERLAELLGNSRAPLEKEVARRVAQIWVDYQLAGAAAAKGDSLNDPEMIDSVMWSAIAGQRAKKFYDVVSASWSANDPAQNEARYNQGQLLAARHIIFVTPQQGLTAAARDSIRGRLERLRPQLTPANFAQMASQHSQEPGAKERGGSLGVFQKGAMVPEFEKALLAIQPGQISPVIQTSFGYHVIYRPRFAEVKDEFEARIGDAAVQQAEQDYLTKLETNAEVKYKDNLAATTKAVAADLDGHKDDKTVVVEYKGGTLTAGELARWIEAFPPQANITAQIQSAPDSIIPTFVKGIVRNELVLKAADSAGVKLDAAELASIRTTFASQVTRVWTQLGVDPKTLSDSASKAGDKQRVAATRVESYMDRLLGEQAPFVDVPKPLEAALLERYDAKIIEAGLDRAVERASRIRAVNDSTRATQQPGSQVPMPGAQGGPPQGMRPQGAPPQGAQPQRPAPATPAPAQRP
jgi:peptidyl-prolyl cis-trans isomerase D